MSLFVGTHREFIKLRCDHAALRFKWELTKLAYYDRKFRSDQLRVPKGEDGGGRFAFEGDNAASAQPVFFAAPAAALAAKTIEAGIALYLGLSKLGSADPQPVITFNAKEYEPDGKGSLKFESVATLSRENVDSACPKFDEVQQRTDAAVDHVRVTRGDMRPADFGTAVHSDLKDQIKDLHDPDFRAEVSYIKQEKEATYGQKGSIRIDVLERVGNGTVCVYDIKTGQSGLGIGRMNEIAENVFTVFPDTIRIVVTEVRPRR